MIPVPATVEEAGAWAKALTSIGVALWAVFGPLGKRFRQWRARRRESERMVRILADSVNVLLRDRIRRTMPDGDRWWPEHEDFEQATVRTYEARNELFRADGHQPIPRQKERVLSEEDVLAWMTRTQAIKAFEKRHREQELVEAPDEEE